MRFRTSQKRAGPLFYGMFEEKGCDMQDTASILKDHGIRPSLQRVCVYHYLRGVKTHPTVDEIYMALLPKYPSLSRTTVYNTLELLLENDLAISLDFGDGFLRYEIGGKERG